MNRRDARVGILFAMPWILGFLLFLAYPILASLFFSFTNYSVLRPPHVIGTANYAELAHDEVFGTALKNTLFYAVGAVPLSTVTAIALALLLNTKVKGLALYRTIFFLPTLVPMVALGTLFMWIFNGDYGILNEGFKTINGWFNWAHLHISTPNLQVASPNWMGDPAWAKWTLILISMWGCGQAMVIYLAGLQNVPVSLYEAAEIDGAKSWAKTKSVTLPLLSPVILFNVIMGIIAAVQIFAVPYVMFPNGAPARSTYFFTSYLFDSAFQYQRMGYASAMGWVMFLVTLVLTMLSLKISERYVHYEV
jgi:multiple sugar transport system permease protein